MSEPTWHIAVQTGPHAGSIYPLCGSTLTIGRKPDNDIIIDHATVSRYHARLTWHGHTYLIEDLGTANGTWVNNVRISHPVPLSPGDAIALGSNVILTVGTARPQPRVTPDSRPAPVERKTRALILAAAFAAVAVLVVVAVLALAAWYFFLREPRTALVARATSTAPVATSVVLPTEEVPAAEVAGTTILLGPGGSVFVPEGALPEEAQISASLTQMPSLPDDVEAVGEALLIRATAQPSHPVTLRLPVPPGVADPADLAIIRVEADGTTTFLMTAVEGNELVAGTPGFSTFVTGRLPPGTKLVLIGPRHLVQGQEKDYVVRHDRPGKLDGATWSASGEAMVIDSGQFYAIVQAMDVAGWAALSYECIDLEGGKRWFGSTLIEVSILYGSNDRDPFRVSVVPRPPVAYAGIDVVHITASVHGGPEPPITWRWEFVGGQKGGPVTTDENTFHFELPADTYPPQDSIKTHFVTAWAKDAKGREVYGNGEYEVMAEPFHVTLVGPQILQWSDPGTYEAYTASVSGGESPYAYSFLLFPGSKQRVDSGETPTATFLFDQPGQHRLEVRCEDGQERTISASLPILVEGGEPLSVRILELPATARVGEKVTARIQIRGGVLIAGEKKAGYKLQVDWGDGSESLVEEDVGIVHTPYEGTVVLASHPYDKARTYTVRVDAWDATGGNDWYEQEITVTEAAASPQPPSTAAPAATPGLLVWVRQEPAVVNVNNDPLEFHAPEPRWAGSSSIITVSDTSFTRQERYVEHEVEWYNVSITCSFDTPPLVLNPGLRYSVKANCSHGGTHVQGGEGEGEQFWYSAGKGFQDIIDPHSVLKYYPWSPDFDGTASMEWMVTAPPASSPGDAFQMYASLWNRAPCNVTWTYRAEYH